jgi:hypothetical protein
MIEERAPVRQNGPVAPTPKSRSGWTVWARLAVGVGLLILLLSRVDLSQRTIRVGADVILGVTVTGFLLLVAQAVSALRWREILGGTAPSWAYLFRLYLIGNFFSLFLPTSIGGDAVRAVAASRALPATSAAVTSVVVDRLIGVAALLFYLLLGLAVAPAMVLRVGAAAEWSIPAPTVVGAIVASGLIGVVAALSLLRRPAVRRRLEPAYGLLRRLWASPRDMTAIVGLGLVVQGLYIVAWALLASALGLNLPPALFVAAVPVVSLLAMLPVSLSGIGVREGAWLLLLAPFGIAAADAVAYSLVFFVSFALVGAVGGVVYSMLGTAPRAMPLETT